MEGIRRSIGADTLGYVSLEGLIAASEQPRSRLCRACFDGEYPIPLPAPELVGKHVLEGIEHKVSSPSRPDPAKRVSPPTAPIRDLPAVELPVERPGVPRAAGLSHRP